MIFAETDFPPLISAQPAPKATLQNQSQPQNPQSTTTAPQLAAYDYHAELDRITAEIENHLKPKFDAIFAQLEQKITNLAEQQTRQHEAQTRQYAEQTQQYEEQQKVNAQNAHQLAWVVDNMKKFFQYAHPNLTFTSPSLHGDGQL